MKTENICPISCESIKEECRLSCGHNFDYESIFCLFEHNGMPLKCPLCRSEEGPVNKIIMSSYTFKNDLVLNTNQLKDDNFFVDTCLKMLEDDFFLSCIGKKQRMMMIFIFKKYFYSARKSINNGDFEYNYADSSSDDDEMDENSFMKISFVKNDLFIKLEKTKLIKYAYEKVGKDLLKEERDKRNAIAADENSIFDFIFENSIFDGFLNRSYKKTIRKTA